LNYINIYSKITYLRITSLTSISPCRSSYKRKNNISRYLLKLGGYGLIRFNIFVDNNLLIFFIYGLLIRTISCCTQLDIKRIIAYSRVSHIIIIPLLIIHNTNLRYKIINMIIYTHAFSRIGLFFLSRINI